MDLLLNKNFVNGGTFREDLYRLKGYKIASCQIRMFEKKSCCSAGAEPHVYGLGLSPGQFDHPQSLADCSFADL